MIRVLLAASIVAILGVASCGGDADSDSTEPPSSPSPTAASTPESADPQEVGDKIGVLYVAALADLGELLADRPPASDIEADVRALKEQYILQFVDLGAQKEVMSSSERAAVDLQVRLALNSVPSDVYSAYADGLAYYQQSGDAELARLIADFNIITQYADYELLKQQEPDEAERLGLR